MIRAEINIFTGGFNMKQLKKIQVIDLPKEHEGLYFKCLEDWSEEMNEAGNHKELWYNKMKDKGLGVKLALDENGTVGGMIQYCPAGYTHIQAKDFYLILCVWVHGYKEGRGDFRKQGMGQALLKAAEEDVRSRGAKGIAAWGVSIPVFMRASWFKKQGYKTTDKNSIAVLLWKSFSDDARPPKWIKQKKKPGVIPGKVTVTSFCSGWCPAQNIVFERASRAAALFGDDVVFQKIHTLDRNVFSEWGILDGLFIDGKEISTGPPPGFDKIKKLIQKRVKKLNKGKKG